MSGVPYTFGAATTSIPLSNLDSNFVTPVTIGNASVALGNTISTIGNLTLNNVTINSGTINASVTESYSLANAVVYSNSSNVGVTSANLTFDGSTLTTLNSAYTGTLTGGTGIVNLGSGQFYKDASGNVGIGVTNMVNKLVTASNATNSKIEIQNTSTTASTNKSSALQFTGSDTVATLKETGNIFVTPADNNYVSSNMLFYTRGSDTVSERMRIDFSGNVGIGTSSPNASAILDAQSTTKGVRMPNMTTTQKNAISSPAAGLMVFDTTLAKLCVYSGSAWQTITSV